MRSKKPPLLSSPPQVGSLVFFVLVLFSAGVAYFFVRTFSLPIELPAFEPSIEWVKTQLWEQVKSGEGFVADIAPLVGMVVLAAWLTAMMVAGLIKRYRRYVDSGSEYKNLIASLRDVRDLDSSRDVNRMKDYPELRRLLHGLKEKLDKRTAELNKRTAELDARWKDFEGREKDVEARQRWIGESNPEAPETTASQEAPSEGSAAGESHRESAEGSHARPRGAARGDDLTERFAAECKKLIAAVEAPELPARVEFSIADLARVLEVVRARLQNISGGPADAAGRNLDDTVTALRQSTEIMQAEVASIADELREGSEAAKEIERLLGDQPRKRGAAPAVDTDALVRRLETLVETCRSIENLSTSLEGLGEEARGVAINTALQAGSGGGTQADLIQLAEDVKEIASHFRNIAQAYAKQAGSLKTLASTLQVQVEQVAGSGAAGHDGHDLKAIAGKVSLWVERLVLLSDKVQSFIPAGSPFDRDAGGADEPARFASQRARPGETTESVEYERYGFDAEERRLADHGEVGGPDREGALEPADLGPGGSEGEMFAELSERVAAPDETPDETPGDGHGAPAPDAYDTEAAGEPPQRWDGGESADAGEHGGGRAPAPRAEEARATDSGAARPEDDGEAVIDLYELGAVDFDPAVHSHAH